MELDVGVVAQHAQGHAAVVAVLEFDMEQEGFAGDPLVHPGEEVSTAVFDALFLGFEQFEPFRIDVQLEQDVGEVDGELAQDVLADDVFVAHGGEL